MTAGLDTVARIARHIRDGSHLTSLEAADLVDTLDRYPLTRRCLLADLDLPNDLNQPDTWAAVATWLRVAGREGETDLDRNAAHQEENQP